MDSFYRDTNAPQSPFSYATPPSRRGGAKRPLSASSAYSSDEMMTPEEASQAMKRLKVHDPEHNDGLCTPMPTPSAYAGTFPPPPADDAGRLTPTINNRTLLALPECPHPGTAPFAMATLFQQHTQQQQQQSAGETSTESPGPAQPRSAPLLPPELRYPGMNSLLGSLHQERRQRAAISGEALAQSLTDMSLQGLHANLPRAPPPSHQQHASPRRRHGIVHLKTDSKLV